MDISIIHLSGIDADYFKVEQPEWLATGAPVCDMKRFSISSSLKAVESSYINSS